MKCSYCQTIHKNLDNPEICFKCSAIKIMLLATEEALNRFYNPKGRFITITDFKIEKK